MYWCVPYLTCNDKPIKINNRVMRKKEKGIGVLKCPVNVIFFHNFSVIHTLKWWMEDRCHLSGRKMSESWLCLPTFRSSVSQWSTDGNREETVRQESRDGPYSSFCLQCNERVLSPLKGLLGTGGTLHECVFHN